MNERYPVRHDPELASIGPFCGMLPPTWAPTLRIDRLEPVDLGLPLDPKFDIMARGRRSDHRLSRPQAVALVLELAKAGC
jgi:alpha-methylacyl-CoA racemase